MKMLTIAASVAAVLVSAGTAMAVPAPGVPVATPRSVTPPVNQYRSNQNLQAASTHIENAIDNLQNDASDYGGHKEKAIDDLQAARQSLDRALDYWNAHRSPSAAGGGVLSNGTMMSQGVGGQGGLIGGQSGSNANIKVVRRNIKAAINALDNDAHDYGGFRVQAIDHLRAADAEMTAALAYIGQPGVQNGSHNPRLSDANLRFSKERVDSAIARLNDDAHDYGGHRAAAVNDLRQADAYLQDALNFDGSHDRFNGATSSSTMGGAMNGTPTIGQGQSNDSLADARQNLEWAIDGMQRDAHDYDGYRVKAIGAMQAARSELSAALQYRNQHGQG